MAAKAQATTAQAAGEAPEAGADDIVFTSPHARLIIYDGKKVIARFLDGVFRTSDSKIVAALRGYDQSREASRLYEEAL